LPVAALAIFPVLAALSPFVMMALALAGGASRDGLPGRIRLAGSFVARFLGAGPFRRGRFRAA
jgi:hypothetical protein